MTKTTKSERKWGKDSDKESPNKRQSRAKPKEPVDDSKYKVLIDGSGFSRAMSYADCIKLVNKMENKAKRLRQPLPSLILVKQ